jgi:regulator of sirC expression with transglutaminase-like and TPR domain
MLLDPFNAGAALNVEAAAAVATRAVGRPVRLLDEHFAAVSKVQILTRMLLNLEGIYVHTEAWDKALGVIDRLLLIDPRSLGRLRNRGAILVKLGRLTEAARQWEDYLERYPGVDDALEVRRDLRRLRQRLASLN